MFIIYNLFVVKCSVVKGVSGARLGTWARRGARKAPQRLRGKAPLVRCSPPELRCLPRYIFLGERQVLE